jgi:hypothetical protein
MPTKHKATEQGREQRRARDRERLKVAAEQLLTSEGWQRWVGVRARTGLARYSLVIWSRPRCWRLGARVSC